MNRRLTRLLPWLILTAAIAALSFLVGCPLRRLFGVGCPLCGMSRALLCALEANFRAAFRYHPLWPLLLPGLGLWVLASHSRPQRAKAVGIGLGLLFLGVFLLRLCRQDPVVWPDFSAGLISGLFCSIF